MKSKKNWRESSTYQILFGDSIVPGCVPFYYRIHLLWRKLTRSVKGRKSKNKFITHPKQEIFNESERLLTAGDREAPFINKSFSSLKSDLEESNVKHIVSELKKLQDILRSKGLRFTAAGGSFKSKDYVPAKELNKMWENAWVIASMRPQPGEVVLDLGGASTIFSFYLASKGCRVYCVDNDWGCHGIIYNMKAVAKRMRWPIIMIDRDLAVKLPFKDGFFDKVFCICVLEHLIPSVRRNVMHEICRVLKRKGTAGFTFDYDAGRNDPRFDKGLRYALRETFSRDVLSEPGLEVMGNQDFFDDCPADFFLGTLFLEKRH